jgi:hypothetical protein
MKRYVKNPDVSQIFIPGHGRILEGQVLMGDDFAKYAPRFLMEVPEAPGGAPLESAQPEKLPVLTEPMPSPAAFVIPSAPTAPQKLEEILPIPSTPPLEEKRGRGRPRKNG